MSSDVCGVFARRQRGEAKICLFLGSVPVYARTCLRVESCSPTKKVRSFVLFCGDDRRSLTAAHTYVVFAEMRDSLHSFAFSLRFFLPRGQVGRGQLIRPDLLHAAGPKRRARRHGRLHSLQRGDGQRSHGTVGSCVVGPSRTWYSI